MATLPTKEQARFDRSLRLWGAEGQQLLADSHLLLLGATSAGCELLKNTILPGLGKFTIVDDRCVSQRDLGNNFFLQQNDLGQPVASASVRALAELNPGSTGTPVVESPMGFAINDPMKYFTKHDVTIVIATDRILFSTINALSKMLDGTPIVLLHISVCGLIGVVRVQSPPKYIVHAEPDADRRVFDMRPFNPFPSLREYFENNNPDDPKFDLQMHSHLPWFVILHYALLRWQENSGLQKEGRLPQNPKEFREIKAVVESMMRRRDPPQGNFLQAMERCNVTLLCKRNTPELDDVLNDRRSANPTSGDHQFWFLAHALRKFVSQEGVMPIPGPIPDFASVTAHYKHIQALFREKAKEDAARIAQLAKEALAACGRDPSEVTSQMAGDFSAHAWELARVEFPAMHAQSDSIDPSRHSNSSTAAFKWMTVHRAWLKLSEDKMRIPGDAKTIEEVEDVSAVAKDAAELRAATGKMCAAASNDDSWDPFVFEFVRAGGCEPITIAATVGAVASQECIKLIQNRRIPISHTLIFDGIDALFTTIGSI